MSCFVLWCLWYISLQWIYLIYLPIFISAASLALGQSYDCPNASEVTLKNMGEMDHYQTTAKQDTPVACCYVLLWLNRFTRIIQKYMCNGYVAGTCAIRGFGDNGSTHCWPPGSLHTLAAGGHIEQRGCILYGLKFFALNIFWEECLQPSLCLMLQMW